MLSIPAKIVARRAEEKEKESRIALLRKDLAANPRLLKSHPLARPLRLGDHRIMKLALAFTLTLSSAMALGATPRLPIAALDAVTEEGALVYVAADGQSVRALDLASETARWEVVLKEAGSVRTALISKLAPHRLLVQVPGRYFTIDMTRGLVASRPGPNIWTFLWRGSGACALRSPCLFQPISCADELARGHPSRCGEPQGRAGSYSHRACASLTALGSRKLVAVDQALALGYERRLKRRRHASCRQA